MKYYVRRQKDGPKVDTSLFFISAGQVLQHYRGLVVLRTRSLQAFLGFFLIFVMALFLVMIRENMSVVQVGLSLRPWPQTNLQAVVSDEQPNLVSDSLLPKRLAQNLVSNELHLSFRSEPDDNLTATIGGTEEIQRNRDSEEVGNHKKAVTISPVDEIHSSEHMRGSSNLQVSLLATTNVNQLPWVQFPYLEVNETEKLILQISRNGTRPCHDIRTEKAQILGLPRPVTVRGQKTIQLYAGPVYELTIVSIGADGQPRCAGGDYYETDLSGARWKSRPPILDYENGTYSVRLQVDPRFAGDYTFRVILLFGNFHGLHYHPQRWARMEDVATYELQFVLPEPLLISRQADQSGTQSFTSPVPYPELPMCRLQDFDKKYWSGRWTREQANEDCEYDRYGRWQCVDGNLQCQKPWCEGPVGSLESNGWVYSAHCAFKIFNKEEAWKCLDNKWVFFWGDSNHIDTIRNLLNFVLGFNHQIKFLDRRMDTTFFSPPHNRSSVRLTSMFNGHSNVTMNYEGLFSLHNPQFAEQLRSFFTGETAPDFMIMNSGLHDGVYWKDVERFMEHGLEFAANFWTDVWNNMRARRPDLLYRTTVSTGGNARNMSFNPHKMELFNHLIVDKFMRMNLDRFHIIDGFDYTYPWHYDHKTNDGVHYGRPPSKSKWAGGNVGHRYFVDVMLVHMLLNAICPSS